MMRWLALLVVAACNPGPSKHDQVHVLDANRDGLIECWSVCNPLTQSGCSAGEKCTWIVNSWMPPIGHIGCVADGFVALGESCIYVPHTAQGFCSDSGLADNCVKGTVCSPVGSDAPGTCKAICDNQGGNPMCDATHACVVEPGLFNTGASSPAAGGICNPACNPLDDNDFDGSGSALTRTGSACGSASVGCYGAPSEGTPSATAFSCMPDLHYATPLRHRSECTTADGCAESDGTILINSCNQGYEPLFRESTAISTAVCVAFCSPLDCYAGHCGSNDSNRFGAAPHRCQTPDAVGNFGSDEECEYMWHEELDGSGNWLPSAYSDTVGVCVDHAAYGEPSCQSLPLAQAIALGCVSTQTAGLPRRR
jgi:hypothetical protein